jgi:hypothetical protein
MRITFGIMVAIARVSSRLFCDVDVRITMGSSGLCSNYDGGSRFLGCLAQLSEVLTGRLRGNNLRVYVE